MPLHTAHYRYPGEDRFDITVRGQDPVGKLFAPTWEMVMGTKNGTVSHDQYTAMYYELLRNRWKTVPGFPDTMRRLAEKAKTGDVTLVCFCKAGSFCHRYILAEIFKNSFNVPYAGERRF